MIRHCLVSRRFACARSYHNLGFLGWSRFFATVAMDRGLCLLPLMLRTSRRPALVAPPGHTGAEAVTACQRLNQDLLALHNHRDLSNLVAHVLPVPNVEYNSTLNGQGNLPTISTGGSKT